jgi:hypothetical protein
MTKQHDAARKLLPIIVDAAASHQFLTYQTAAERIGRPKNHALMVAQVCDLLDAAAAALANVPLLAHKFPQSSHGCIRSARRLTWSH